MSDKKKDLKHWLLSVEDVLTECSEMTLTKNEKRHLSKRLKVLQDIFDESYQWWKHSVPPEQLHEAEQHQKRVHSFFVKLV